MKSHEPFRQYLNGNVVVGKHNPDTLWYEGLNHKRYFTVAHIYQHVLHWCYHDNNETIELIGCNCLESDNNVLCRQINPFARPWGLPEMSKIGTCYVDTCNSAAFQNYHGTLYVHKDAIHYQESSSSLNIVLGIFSLHKIAQILVLHCTNFLLM